MIDFNIAPGAPVQSNDVDLILQQISILFDTNPKEVLGQSDFGSQYDNYLYKLRISNSVLEQQVLSDLYSLELFGFEPHVTVHLLQGTEQDIALIEIVLIRNDETYRQIYKIS